MAADFGVTLPAAFTQAPFDVGAAGLVMTGGVFNLPAAGIVVVCTLLLLAGTQLSARANDLIVVAKVLAIVIVGVAGLHYANVDHWTPFIPANSGRFGEFGISGVMTGAAIAFYAYVGFDCVSSMSQETRDAQRVVPWALILTLVICTVLYVLIALMVTGLADYRQLSVADPVYVALDAAGPVLSWAKSLVGAVVVVGLISTILVGLLGRCASSTRWGDGLLPPWFAAVHPRSRVPIAGTLLTGLGTAS
jgi:APA family basic amino acid/polyamine antiporter